MTTSTSAFTDAEARAFERWGVEAERVVVPARVVNGRASVHIAGTGPPIVLLNGLGTPAAMLAPLMGRLDEVTLHAVDLPGFGLTDTTPTVADDLRGSMVQFVGEVLDGLGLEQPILLANSLGSWVTSRFAIEHPARVRALVHVGCPAVALDTSAPLPMRLMSSRLLSSILLRLQPPSPKQVEQLSRLVNEHPLPPEIADLLLATERLPGFEPTFRAMLHRLVRIRGARPDMRLTADELMEIPHPTLLVFGVDDPMGGPEVGERMCRHLPNAELHVVDGGHAPWIHHAEQIAPLVKRFTGRLTAHR